MIYFSIFDSNIIIIINNNNNEKGTLTLIFFCQSGRKSRICSYMHPTVFGFFPVCFIFCFVWKPENFFRCFLLFLHQSNGSNFCSRCCCCFQCRNPNLWIGNYILSTKTARIFLTHTHTAWEWEKFFTFLHKERSIIDHAEIKQRQTSFFPKKKEMSKLWMGEWENGCHN